MVYLSSIALVASNSLQHFNNDLSLFDMVTEFILVAAWFLFLFYGSIVSWPLTYVLGLDYKTKAGIFWLEFFSFRFYDLAHHYLLFDSTMIAIYRCCSSLCIKTSPLCIGVGFFLIKLLLTKKKTYVLELDYKTKAGIFWIELFSFCSYDLAHPYLYLILPWLAFTGVVPLFV